MVLTGAVLVGRGCHDGTTGKREDQKTGERENGEASV